MILDYHMPVTSGMELLRWLREQNAPADKPYVVMCSADDDAEEEARELGAVGFIRKGQVKSSEAIMQAMRKYAGCSGA